MIMIVGGAFQGKTEFAKKRFSLADNEIMNGEDCRCDAVFSARCVKNYQLLIKRLLDENVDPQEFTRRLCRENPGLILIINEIGGGIVPLEKSERIWREQTGRAGCAIADSSSAVIRICCGIPTVIKGEI